MTPTPDARPRSSDLERAVAIALRTVHLGAVTVLGAALMGAPVSAGPAGAVALVSGLLLAALDLAARRIRLGELAGAVLIAKLAIVAWLAWGPASELLALAAFWTLLVVSSLSAHAPKALRHWRPGRARAPAQARDSKAGRPG